MSFGSPLGRPLVLGALAVSAAGVASAPAAAATVAVKPSSALELRLSASTARSLAASGVALRPTGPAKYQRRVLRLPVRRATTSASGVTLTHTGAVTLRSRGRTVRLSGWRTRVTAKGATASALVAGKRRTVAAIGGGRVSVDTATGRVSVSSGRVSLRPAVLRSLRRSLVAPRLRGGVLGRATISGVPAATSGAGQAPAPTPAPAPAPSPAPAPIPTPGPETPVPVTPRTIAAASTVWTFDHVLTEGFTSDTSRFRAIDGATGDVDSGFSYVGTGGSYDVATRAGTVSFSGGICGGYVAGPYAGTCPKTTTTTPAHQIQLSLSNPTIELAGDAGTLTADVFAKGGGPATGGVSVDVEQRLAFATLDLSGVVPTPSADGTSLTWTDVPVRLTAAGAAAYYQDQRAATEGTEIDPITFSVDFAD